MLNKEISGMWNINRTSTINNNIILDVAGLPPMFIECRIPWWANH